jgi:hypothetical protein
MIERFSRGLVFVAGSVVGGLALAFVIVAARPDLVRRSAAVAPLVPISAARPAPEEPGPARVTYSAAVRRGSPSVVNI